MNFFFTFFVLIIYFAIRSCNININDFKAKEKMYVFLSFWEEIVTYIWTGYFYVFFNIYVIHLIIKVFSLNVLSPHNDCTGKNHEIIFFFYYSVN